MKGDIREEMVLYLVVETAEQHGYKPAYKPVVTQAGVACSSQLLSKKTHLLIAWNDLATLMIGCKGHVHEQAGEKLCPN